MREHTLDQDTERDTGYILLNRSKLIRIDAPMSVKGSDEVWSFNF